MFETHQDFCKDAFHRVLQRNLQEENLLRKWIMPFFLKQQLRMAYHSHEVIELVKQTAFAETFRVEKVTLGHLPIWLRIELTKR